MGFDFEPTPKLARRLRLANSLFSQFYSVLHTGSLTVQDTLSLVHIVRSSVTQKLSDNTLNHIRDTLLQYVDETISDNLIYLLSYQIACRWNELCDGILLRSGSFLREEWLPLEILKINSAVWQGTPNAGIALLLFCLSGRLAGQQLYKVVPEGWLNWLVYQIGFSKRLTYDYEPANLLGLRFYGYVAPQEDGYELTEWNSDCAFKTYNRHMLALRYRFDVVKESDIWRCPYDLDDLCIDCKKSTVQECVLLVEQKRKQEKLEYSY